jgi:hypothetical protein
MGAEHRRNIGLYGSAGDLVRHSTAAVDALDDAGHLELASWLQASVLAVVGRLTVGEDPQPALERVEQALHVVGARVGLHPAQLRALAAAKRTRRWWNVDPVRDAVPPTILRAPRITVPPDRPVGAED